jgi:glucokinase
VVAVDVGGTETKAALVAGTPEGVVAVGQQRRTTPRGVDGPATAEAVVDLVVDVVDGLRAAAGHDVDAIGVVVPGETPSTD